MTSGVIRDRVARVRSGSGWQAFMHSWLPPVDRRAFWAIQALVLMIAVIHAWVEIEHLFGEGSPLYLFPTTLYLIPCTYAAVMFGMRGAALTAAWSGTLVVISVLIWHDGLEGVGEVLQVAWIGIAAVFVGSRVDRERAARREAERRESARHASEERYRAIMDNVDEPIILLDDAGSVVEANRSAAVLLGDGVEDLRGARLPGSDGARIKAELDAVVAGVALVTPIRLGQPERWFEVVPMATSELGASNEVQLLLRDVTQSYEREQGLESIARQALTTREEERQRIARELHDGPLQSLVQLWRELDSLAEDVPESDRGSVMAARIAAEAVADELRRFSRDLRPSVLDDLGISAAIRSEAESLEQRAGIAVRVNVDGRGGRLDQEVELALLRITQEAVRNIEQHSQASSVVIDLEFGPTRVGLVIHDDGVGMDPTPTVSALLSGNHLGLVGMQERARLAGGRLDVTAPDDGGLTIEVVIPVGESLG